MYSAEYLNHYARDRLNESRRYAENQRALPAFRQRLAYKLQALASWLEQGARAPQMDAPLTLERA